MVPRPVTTMKPYYDDGVVVIYHGDCLELLPTVVADVVITDPPYGLDFRGNAWDRSTPEWLVEARRVADVVMFTTAPTTMWAYPRPDWVLCWHRLAAMSRAPSGGFNHWTPILVYGAVKFAVDTLALNSDAHKSPVWIDHPTPKPLALATWLVAATSVNAIILDPFMGSGTTLRAAKDLGRKAIGIEIEERYCEIAAKRMAQGVLPLDSLPATAESLPIAQGGDTAVGSARTPLPAPREPNP